jgi:hypothetical protein
MVEKIKLHVLLCPFEPITENGLLLSYLPNARIVNLVLDKLPYVLALFPLF